MLLTAALIMAGISCYTEVKLVHGSAWLRETYTVGRFGIEGIYWNTAGSFVLSYLIGLMFSAEGMTVMLGGAISTGLSQMYFSAEGYTKKMGWSVDGAKQSIKSSAAKAQSTKDSATKLYNDFKQPIADFTKIVLMILKVITAPFVIVRKLSAAYTERSVAK